MRDEFILYGQNLMKLVLVTALIGLFALVTQPQSPKNGPQVLAYLPSSSR
jgi:hypothetical protein